MGGKGTSYCSKENGKVRKEELHSVPGKRNGNFIVFQKERKKGRLHSAAKRRKEKSKERDKLMAAHKIGCRGKGISTGFG